MEAKCRTEKVPGRRAAAKTGRVVYKSYGHGALQWIHKKGDEDARFRYNRPKPSDWLDFDSELRKLSLQTLLKKTAIVLPAIGEQIAAIKIFEKLELKFVIIRSAFLNKIRCSASRSDLFRSDS